MQLKNTMLAFALAVVAGFGLTRCGGDEGGTGGCTVDSDCTTEGEICHQTAKACVKTCSAAVDCPSTAKTCDTAPWLVGTTGADGGSAAKICQCATDQLCGGGDNVCSTVDKICATKCTSSTDCAGRTCDTATGQCGAGTGGSGTTCSIANAQPDVCGYGSYCGADAKCATVAAPTCPNFPNPTFNAATSTGPVIFSAVTDDSGQPKCADPAQSAFPVAVRAYIKDGTFPANKNQLNGFFYVTVNGTQQDIPASLLSGQYYTVAQGGKEMTAKFTLCGAAGTGQIVAGFHFTNGNEFCTTFQK